MDLPAVHLEEGRPDVRRDRDGGWAFPLGEAGMPRRTASTPTTRAHQLTAIVRFLAVERSARYARQGGSTYCNVYAHDYCYLAGAYLPRVWWTATAMAALVCGEPLKPASGSLPFNTQGDWGSILGGEAGRLSFLSARRRM